MKVTPVNPFYGPDGRPMDSVKFRERFKERVLVESSYVGEVRIVTEFVGVNHNPERRGAPKIYETTVRSESEFVASRWAGGFKRSLCVHYWYVFRALLWWGWRLGGAPK